MLNQPENVSQVSLESDLIMTEKKPRNKPRKARKNARALQISMPMQVDQISLAVLSLMSGSNASQVIRDLLTPYLEFVKKEFFEKEGIINEYGSLEVDPELVIAMYQQKVVSNPKLFLDKIKEYEKLTGIGFEAFLHPENLFQQKNF